MIYIRGALYVLCMAINRLYPNAKIRTEYQLHNAMYINITNLELTDDMVFKLRIIGYISIIISIFLVKMFVIY